MDAPLRLILYKSQVKVQIFIKIPENRGTEDRIPPSGGAAALKIAEDLLRNREKGSEKKTKDTS